jgi:Carboxypeptidase regulatory-like domain/TonB dependent receptor
MSQTCDSVNGWHQLRTSVRWLMVLGLFCAPASAQVGGNVGGVVKDSTGGVIPGASITLTNTNNTSVVQTVQTGGEGNYRAVNLQPGTYEISAEVSGFATTKRLVQVFVGTDVTVDFTLRMADVAESVTVAGQSSALMIEVNKSQPSSVIGDEQVQALPNLSRNFLALAQLMPGAAPLPTGRFGPTKFGGIADQRSGYTTIIDGSTVDDATWGSPVINMTQDAVQEFKVFRHQFDAQYGSALNAVVNVVSKSGGDKYRGTGYYFGRDAALNATNAFASTKPPFSQSRTGGTVGGPMPGWKNTNFFGATEYLRVNNSQITALPANNPFAAAQNGIYPFTTTEKFADLKVDHRFSNTNSAYVRYAYDNQFTPGGGPVNSTAQIDYSISHSLVVEDNWVVSQRLVNTARYSLLSHNLYTLPTNYDLGIIRPSYSFGQNFNDPQYFPRKNHYFQDTIFLNTADHDIKVGGNFTIAHSTNESHFYEHGQFTFTTDLPFDPNVPATWPVALSLQTAGKYTYDSKQVGIFFQDDWRVAPNVRLNLGFRYDLDTNLRDNAFYEALLANPGFTGMNTFISTNRGNDYSGWQPRLGVAWDVKGNGSFVVRAGTGKYWTRMRPWFAQQAEQQTSGAAVRITDAQQLRNYPNLTAVLGGKSLEDYVSAGAGRFASILPDDFKLPTAINSAVGFGWRLNSYSSLNADYIHDHTYREVGAHDANLPATGAISASNPRPVPRFTQVEVTINNGQAWYDALELQFSSRAKGLDQLSVSYTYSKSILDAVTFYNTFSGTDRTPDNYGRNPTDTPHNLSMAFTTNPLPGKFVLSGVYRYLSTGPFGISAGIDLDGDGNIANDRPKGLPVTVGRGDVDAQLALINAFRANPCSFVYAGVGCTARPQTAVSRDLLDLIPLIDLNLRLTRMFDFNNHNRVELFFEGYNTLNHVTKTGGTTSMTSASIFLRTGALDARQLQWGARFRF